MPAEVEVVFQVEAQRGEGNSVNVNVALLDLVEAGSERSTQVTRSEGNTITIRFRNVVFATNEQLVGLKSAEELATLLQALRDAGLTLTR